MVTAHHLADLPLEGAVTQLPRLDVFWRTDIYFSVLCINSLKLIDGFTTQKKDLEPRLRIQYKTAFFVTKTSQDKQQICFRFLDVAVTVQHLLNRESFYQQVCLFNLAIVSDFHFISSCFNLMAS